MPITGSYKLTKSENFEEYMKSVGVGLVMRKMAATATPTTEITQNGDDWNIKTSTTFKTTDIKFKLGQEFDEETADGRNCKSTITLDGDTKLVHSQKCGDQTLQILREFTDDEMKMTLEGPGGVVSTRVYKKL
ncbi:sodium/calcium exchanger regulatory protein 1 isoform X1 [Folsomia candida]|uniref:sodium/calcium exchanger regulatory protein 1 isoform X1 n=2 Tax=Folsomia candida TaxID=158441 RepID=UPI000B904332|nr:sodium/calcium exchanger regulatory protein 1 isoform X1 [Folsomia candida]